MTRLPVLTIYSEVFLRRYMKGVPFSNKRYTKGVRFLKKWYIVRDWTSGRSLPV